jgi:UDP-N-acetylglucosamine 2-epimerase
MPAQPRLKLMVIVGTRPELIKLCRVIVEAEKHFQLVFVHTGQNFDFELNGIFFRDLGLRKPDYMLDAVGNSLAQTIANIIAKTDEVMDKERPDALLLLGDTNSCLSAICAKRRKIPIFHMEAGNRCFDVRVPEEINRRIVDHTSDINLVYTEHARRYLLREGLRPDLVLKTGSPMFEVLTHYQRGIDESTALADQAVEPRRYFVVSAHREENVDDPARLALLLDSLNAIAKRYRFPIIVSTHARTRARLDAAGLGAAANPLIRFLRPLGFFDYVRLQKDALCVISDSGTITEESAILGFPAVTIRETHERPEGMDVGTLIMCGIAPSRVLDAINIVTSQTSDGFRPGVPLDYQAPNVAAQVVRIIAGYTDFVNRVVWGKTDSAD